MDFCYIANTIEKKNRLIQKELDVSTANSYRGDFFGLLHKHLNIRHEIIQHIISSNGFNTSSDYNGETNIVLASSDMITEYLG